jgi:hypothetical protein
MYQHFVRVGSRDVDMSSVRAAFEYAEKIPGALVFFRIIGVYGTPFRVLMP